MARRKCFIRNLGHVISLNPLPLPVPSRTHFTLAIEPSHTSALVSKNRRHSRTPSWLTRRGHVRMQVLSHCNHATLHSTEIFTKGGMRLVAIFFRKWNGSTKTIQNPWNRFIVRRPSFAAVTLPQGSLRCCEAVEK